MKIATFFTFAMALTGSLAQAAGPAQYVQQVPPPQYHHGSDGSTGGRGFFGTCREVPGYNGSYIRMPIEHANGTTTYFNEWAGQSSETKRVLFEVCEMKQRRLVAEGYLSMKPQQPQQPDPQFQGKTE